MPATPRPLCAGTRVGGASSGRCDLPPASSGVTFATHARARRRRTCWRGAARWDAWCGVREANADSRVRVCSRTGRERMADALHGDVSSARPFDDVATAADLIAAAATQSERPPPREDIALELD